MGYIFSRPFYKEQFCLDQMVPLPKCIYRMEWGRAASCLVCNFISKYLFHVDEVKKKFC